MAGDRVSEPSSRAGSRGALTPLSASACSASLSPGHGKQQTEALKLARQLSLTAATARYGAMAIRVRWVIRRRLVGLAFDGIGHRPFRNRSSFPRPGE